MQELEWVEVEVGVQNLGDVEIDAKELDPSVVVDGTSRCIPWNAVTLGSSIEDHILGKWELCQELEEMVPKSSTMKHHLDGCSSNVHKVVATTTET